MSQIKDGDRMGSANAIRSHQKEWFSSILKRVSAGEPYVISHADECEEILTIMGIPVQVVNNWNALIAIKGLNQYYQTLLNGKGYDTSATGILLIGAGLASTMDNNPDIAPWGGLPKPMMIIGSRSDVDMRILEIWAREFDCLYYALQKSGSHFKPHPPYWWELLKDRWDELIDSRCLDFRVEQEKALIHFLEVKTGRKFDYSRLWECMELINEQMDYWRKARDLICQTIPCPVNIYDQLTTYQTMWHRGTKKGRDLIKAFYEEVKNRVENGIGANPNEKIRLMWEDGTPPAWASYVEEKYDAVCIAPLYSSIAYEAYTRKIGNDPLRAMASRHLMLFNYVPEWRLRDAKLCRCDGVIGVSGAYGKINTVFDGAGIPFLELPRDTDDPEIRSFIDVFIENKIHQGK
ncbi:MAG: 2-hydroxyacyl-CoA dehydratase [Dehalococcoidales bacterium]|nr:2-hydroxyacyl-CoA dehydratase [Dehalococcoidales bacterium]